MAKLIQAAQLVTWLIVAAYFAVLIGEHTKIKPMKASEIVAQLEMQVNYELE